MRVGTPVGVVRINKEKGTREIIPLGKITGLEINHKTFQVVKRNQIGAGKSQIAEFTEFTDLHHQRSFHQIANIYRCRRQD